MAGDPRGTAMPVDDTIKVYDARASDYEAMALGAPEPCLPDFIAALPPGGHVLDLGCGPGHIAARLADAGFRVTAIDASAEMVRLAGRHPGVNARQAHFDDLADDSLYDGIWAGFSLLHSPRADMPRHLSALRRAARPGARLHLSVKLGTGEGTDRIGRFYTYYRREELKRLLQEADFTILSHATGNDPGLSGESAEWIAFAAHA